MSKALTAVVSDLLGVLAVLPTLSCPQSMEHTVSRFIMQSEVHGCKAKNKGRLNMYEYSESVNSKMYAARLTVTMLAPSSYAHTHNPVLQSGIAPFLLTY